MPAIAGQAGAQIVPRPGIKITSGPQPWVTAVIRGTGKRDDKINCRQKAAPVKT